MKKHKLKRFFIIITIIAGSLAVLLLIVPLLISPKPLDNLNKIEDVKTSQSKFITVDFQGTDGIDIHYLEESNPDNTQDQVFILLHGSMYNAFTWKDVIDDFGSLGRAVAYDQTPFGLSEKIIEGEWTDNNPYSQKAAVEQLLSFMDALNIDKAVLVGSSYGGTLAVRTADEHPERVEALILVDPAVYVNETMPEWLLNSPQMKNLGIIMARMLSTSESFFKTCYKDPEIFKGSRRELTLINTKVEDWDSAMWQYLRKWGSGTGSYRPKPANISAPTLIVFGEEDKVIPIEDGARLASEIPDSKLVIIPNTGHLPHEETPDLFFTEVENWLNENFISD